MVRVLSLDVLVLSIPKAPSNFKFKLGLIRLFFALRFVGLFVLGQY